MSEYIERDSLVGLFLDKKYKDNSSNINYADVIQIINSQPPADVQEVRHARWECEYKDENYDIGWTFYTCSNCGNITCATDDVDLYKFCPDCGAKMDEE